MLYVFARELELEAIKKLYVVRSNVNQAGTLDEPLKSSDLVYVNDSGSSVNDAP